MPLTQLIYVSSATRELSDSELDEILDVSLRLNQPKEITGMLLYSRGSFMQVLEGEQAVVEETYARICRDVRHHGVIQLMNEPVPAREFASWRMGFRRLTERDAEAHPGYAPFFSQGFSPQAMGARPGLALEILKTFSVR